MFFWFVIFSGFSQTNFNLRENFGFPATLLTSAYPTDSCFYFTGIIADSVSPYLTGNIFLKYDLDGEPLFLKTLLSSHKTYETWLGNIIPTPDGNLIDVGFTVDSTRKAILIKFTPDGDTLFTREYFSYYYPQNPFIVPHQIIMTPLGEFYILNNIEKENGIDNDFSVMKLNQDAHLIWQKKYGDTWDDIVRSLIIDTDGGLIIGSSKEKNVIQNFINRTHIIKIDTAGNIQWEYLSPANILQDAARDMVKTADGGLVVASGRGIEVPINANVGDLRWEKGYVFKLDANKQVVWEVEVEDSMNPSYLNYFSKLVAVDNGNGFVAAGQFIELLSDTARDIFGWLVKVSAEGELLWLRKHHVVESNLDWHTVYDFKPTADGGFILVGEAKDSDADTLRQQAWLLKLDSFGCLVPGCQLADAAQEEAAETGTLLLYPNPAGDYLNFFYRPPAGAPPLRFRIFDAQGQVMKEFAGHPGEMTYIVPVWDWAAGVYFLQAEVAGRVRAEKFIKK
jgi:hypothetical protein